MMRSPDHNPFMPIGIPAWGRVVLTKLEQSAVALARFRSDGGQEVVKSLPPEDAFVAIFQLGRLPPHEFWQGGKREFRNGAARSALNIVDISAGAGCRMDESFDSVHLHIPRAVLDEIAEAAEAPRIGSLRAPRGWDTFDPFVESMKACLLDALDRHDAVSRLLVDHTVLAMVAHIVRAYGGIGHHTRRRSGGLAPWQERRAKEFVAANIDKDLSLRLIASQCDLSPSHFCRAFKVSTGMTPHEWLQTCRVDHAKELLLRDDASLAEIAVRCGFSDQSHFSRIFSRLAGTSPGAWRRFRSAA